jgi:hypothetical protein
VLKEVVQELVLVAAPLAAAADVRAVVQAALVAQEPVLVAVFLVL